MTSRVRAVTVNHPCDHPHLCGADSVTHRSHLRQMVEVAWQFSVGRVLVGGDNNRLKV
jgi:hypothetical protein